MPIFFLIAPSFQCFAGVFDSIKSGYDEGKRILKGDPKIEYIYEQNLIKAQGSFQQGYLDNNYIFKIDLYNNSSYVVTKVDYQINMDGDSYEGELSCNSVDPKSAGSCQGHVQIFKMTSKWSFSTGFYGYQK